MDSRKEYHKSRKFTIVVFLLFFTYSLATFQLRQTQRIRNEKIIDKMHNNKDASKVVNKKSVQEDSMLILFANLLVVVIFIVADKRNVFE